MDSAELLAQLADIHLPEPVGAWPPAMGWWLLAAALAALLVFGGRRLLAYWRRRRYCAAALGELERVYEELANAENSDASRLRYVNAFNSILRRVALAHFPGRDVAGLGGEDWLRFLKAHGSCLGLDRDLAAALSHGRFQPAIALDTGKLHNFGREWIRSVYGRRATPRRGGRDA